MVRLERVLNRRVKDKEYFRWRVTNIPSELIEELGWKHTDTIEAETRGDALIIRRRKKERA